MKILLATAVALAIAVSSVPAFATGALVVGIPQDVAKNGFSAGLNSDMRSKSAARNDAMAQCRSGAGASASTRALCKVVKTYSNQCAVIAADPRPRRAGVGWAVAASSKTAGTQAVQQCRQTGGSQWCKVIAVACDGSAK